MARRGVATGRLGNGETGDSEAARSRCDGSKNYVPALKGMMAVYGYDGRGVGRRVGEGEMLR